MIITFGNSRAAVWKLAPVAKQKELIATFNDCVHMAMTAMERYAQEQGDALVSYDPRMETSHGSPDDPRPVGGTPGAIESLEFGPTIKITYPANCGRLPFSVPFKDIKIFERSYAFNVLMRAYRNDPSAPHGHAFWDRVCANPQAFLTAVPLSQSEVLWGQFLLGAFHQAGLRTLHGFAATVERLLWLGLASRYNRLDKLRLEHVVSSP